MKKQTAVLLGTLLAFTALFALNVNQPKLKMIVFDNFDNYEEAWKKIDSLENQGLFKEALEAVDALYASIKAEPNPSPAQIVKVITYKAKYKIELEEEGFFNAIRYFESEIAAQKQPVKAMLQSMTGELYYRYYEQNRWEISERTAGGSGDDPDDFKFWDEQKFMEKARGYHEAALAYEDAKRIELKVFADVIEPGENAYDLPTLYDLLANRALAYYSNEAMYMTQPVYAFYLEQAEAFGSAAQFTNYKFESQDATSSKLRAVQLYQELTKHRLRLDSRGPLVELELNRLNFVKENSVHPDKDLLHKQALEQLIKQYPKEAAVAEAMYYLAVWYNEKGGEYKPNPSGIEQAEKGYRKKAVELCQEANKLFPGSVGASMCASLENQIKFKELTVTIEKVAQPDKESLAKVDYKNISEIHFKVMQLDFDSYWKINSLWGDPKLGAMLKLPLVKSWSLTLPQDGDYNAHSAEFALPALKNGAYVLIASANPEFSYQNNAVFYTNFHSSNIAYMQRQNKGASEFFVVDQNTGQPLSGATVDFYSQEYRPNTRTYEIVKAGSAVTDKDGFASTNAQNKTLYTKMTNGKDQLFTGDGFYNYRTSDYYNTNSVTEFFLDRGIYRPGQTVYFKGMVYVKDREGKPSIVPNRTERVSFKDANWQEVAFLDVKTNEFGTFNGSFTVPMTGMTGTMTLGTQNGSTKYFQVEEYKRPKFEVSFDPIKESYKLGDKVKVKGLAKTYAGSNLDGAKVTYRVTRRASFPYWRWWMWGWYIPFNTNETEMTNGVIDTEDDGTFTIEFEASADKSIPAKNKPQFYYTVYADVSDMTGETHASSTSLTVGYVSINLDVDLAGELDRNKENKPTLSTTNLNGEFVPLKGRVKVEALSVPNKVFRKRFWGQTEHQLISAADFAKQFPNYPYKDEDQMTKWPVSKVAMEGDFNTENFKYLNLATKAWAPGAYKLTLMAKDASGEDIEVVKFFTLYDAASKKPAVPVALNSRIDNSKLEPGETATINVASSMKTAWVLYELEHNGKSVERRWLKVEDAQQLKITALEEWRGNVHYHLSSVADRRAYNLNETVLVPWSNKELKIEYGTFRDKLYPGQNEEWQLKISGPKGDKVAAEFVFAMYDASLDVFASNDWGMYLWPSSNAYLSMNSYYAINSVSSQMLGEDWNMYINALYRGETYLRWFSLGELYGYYENAGAMPGVVYDMAVSEEEAPRSRMEDRMVKSSPPPPPPAPAAAMEQLEVSASSMTTGATEKSIEQVAINDKKDASPDPGLGEVKVRTNLNETVFFFPEMNTDEEGNITIKFKMNEALTKWKFLSFGHTKSLQTVSDSRFVQTQKDLMVMPNPPRFMREGDNFTFAAKVSNLTKADMTGSAQLLLFDALTMKPVDAELGNSKYIVTFSAKAGQSDLLNWNLKIPYGFTSPITWRVVAKAGDFSDGEESTLPLLTNTMLVTETMPLPVRGGQTKTFNFKRMTELSSSSTLRSHKLTLEFTPNPAWYAIQALPYLFEYPYECTEQTFNRLYANSLGAHIANSNPKIKRVFDAWKNQPEALLSNLSKNQELKTALLEETPWVLQAQSEEQQKKNVGLLFDLNRMGDETNRAVAKLRQRQLSNGGFSWFTGGPDDYYITQYIVEGMGHMDRLGLKILSENDEVQDMMNRAVSYVDERALEIFNKIKEKDRGNDNLSYMAIHYLYARSFYFERGLALEPRVKVMFDYYMTQANKYWTSKGLYMQGMLALAAQRSDNKTLADAIVKSLKSRSLNSEEMGMYWKYTSGYFWYELPIETHALMIEVFEEVAKDEKAVDDLKTWLIKNKQTNHWATSKATAAACYSLLLSGDNWLLEDKEVEITMGKNKLDQSKIAKEAGTGYFKISWDKAEIKPEMGQIKIENPNKNPAWGALYWQYFEQLDKITSFKETPLKVSKKLFKKVNSDRGPVLQSITEQTPLKTGDRVTVRIELVVDRDMEYVHLKDMRASAFEPLNTISSYQYQGGLGYFQNTRDLSTNFFIGYLPKGSYVLEYELFATQKGNFSNGITTTQCMYAPEFSTHTQGIRVNVE